MSQAAADPCALVRGRVGRREVRLLRRKLAQLHRVTNRARSVDGRRTDNCQNALPGRAAVETAKALGVKQQFHRRQL